MASVPVATVDPATGDAVTPARPASPAAPATRAHGRPTRSPPGEKESSSSSPFVAAARRVRSLYPQEAKRPQKKEKAFSPPSAETRRPVDNHPSPNRVLCLPTTFPLRHRHRLRPAARGSFRNTGPGESTYPRARGERLAKPVSQQVLHRPLQRHARLHDPWTAALPR